MIIFKVCKCPYCGTLQLSTAKKTFKCIKCGRTRAFASKMGVPVIKEFTSGQLANKYIAEYKRISSESEPYCEPFG